MWNLSYFYSTHCSGISIIDYEHINVDFVEDQYLNMQI